MAKAHLTFWPGELKGVGEEIPVLTSLHCCACPQPGPRFPVSCHCLFVTVFCRFNNLRQEMFVGFVDIGGIVNHHCLNLLFNKVTLSSQLPLSSGGIKTNTI